jgi:uncharacterized Zn-finger protein
MASDVVQSFCNDVGSENIRIGVRNFKCLGATPPLDHPHVYLEIGASGRVSCPYCATLYVYDQSLEADKTDPPGCICS